MPSAYVEFLKAAARHPFGVATVFPTSRALAERLARTAETATTGQVVELGAGTGAITQYLAPVARERLVAMEIDPEMVRFLRAQYPNARVVAASAEDVGRIVSPGTAGAVVASLPWTVLSLPTLDRILAGVHGVLAPGGVFVTYLCLNVAWHPRARAFASRLRAHFPEVSDGPIEWRNLPPATVWTARKAGQARV
jgi:phospholipid N-methyltransferase